MQEPDGNPTPPTLHMKLTGDAAKLGVIGAAEVANLILELERALRTTAGVLASRRQSGAGRRRADIEGASHFVLVGLRRGSIDTVLALPRPETETPELVQADYLADQALAALLKSKDIAESPDLDIARGLFSVLKTAGVGDRHRALIFTCDAPNVPARVILRSSDRKRLADYLGVEDAAAEHGTLTGRLVEADFEGRTARLRDDDGRAIEVAFGEAMDDEVQRALRNKGGFRGMVVYDRRTNEARRVKLERVVTPEQQAMDAGSAAFRVERTITELATEQRTTGILDLATFGVSGMSWEDTALVISASDDDE